MRACRARTCVTLLRLACSNMTEHRATGLMLAPHGIIGPAQPNPMVSDCPTRRQPLWISLETAQQVGPRRPDRQLGRTSRRPCAGLSGWLTPTARWQAARTGQAGELARRRSMRLASSAICRRHAFCVVHDDVRRNSIADRYSRLVRTTFISIVLPSRDTSTLASSPGDIFRTRSVRSVNDLMGRPSNFVMMSPAFIPASWAG